MPVALEPWVLLFIQKVKGTKLDLLWLLKRLLLLITLPAFLKSKLLSSLVLLNYLSLRLCLFNLPLENDLTFNS